MDAYWWKGTHYPNLGDELARIVLERGFDVTPRHSPLATADLASVGSLLGWIWEKPEVQNRKTRLHVVGSGFMSADTPVTSLPFLRIHCVRGYLSKHKLGSMDNWEITVGDPGLITPQLLNGSSYKRNATKYGIILHHRHSNNDEIKSRFDHLNAKFISIRTDDLDKFAHHLRSCDVILSQSLHGLVLADSLGIPNAWLTLGPIHSGGNFKFYDYFSSVGRPFYLHVSGVPGSTNDIDKMIWHPDVNRIKNVAGKISQSYERAVNELALSES